MLPGGYLSDLPPPCCTCAPDKEKKLIKFQSVIIESNDAAQQLRSKADEQR